jgi:lipopolysaccharide/colanic/teichoic acid biosynthesis glycosyltransferase
MCVGKIIKYIMDKILSLIGMIVLMPIFFIISLVIKFTSPGPILYEWNVIGRNGVPFRSWKFRTMVMNADALKGDLLSQNEMMGPVFKMNADPRITDIGKILRKYSLDELPQLMSVLKGDMSLVGPRPSFPHEWEKFEDWQRRKLSVTPGLTCLWQVSGRNEISDFDHWVKMDLQYIDDWSIWLDLKIILKTVKAVLNGTGK